MYYKFISLFNSDVFKYIWLNGKVNAKKYLCRLISSIVGYKVDKYSLINESKNRKKLNGVLLVNEDYTSKIYIEFNNNYKLSTYISNFYKEESDCFNDMGYVNVDYIIFNDCGNYREDWMKFYRIYDNRVNVYDIFLNSVVISDFNLQKDFMLLNAKSYREMDRLAKNDFFRLAVVKELKCLSCDYNYYNSYVSTLPSLDL